MQNKGIFLKVARIYCAIPDDREDLVQEMMFQAWRAFDKYKSEYKFSTWLYKICFNVAISFYRKNCIRIKQTDRLLPDMQLISEKEQNQDEQIQLLYQFIGELQEFDRAIILLYLEDKKHSEISEILGISVSNVGTKIGRIKEQLSKKFNRMEQYHG